MSAAEVDPRLLRRVVVGATVGSIVEWFDVAVYAYLVVVIGGQFFPSHDPTVSTLSSLATFGITFLIRPVGGIFFGHLGDRIGRQRTLAAVILLVSGATFLIGVLPTYATVGALAPILLVVLRLAQGFSAGGELSGASAFVAEYAPAGRRGYLTSWVEFGAIAGFLLGSALTLLLNVVLSDPAMSSVGWRVPFLLAAPLGVIGWYIRSRLQETPEFVALVESGQRSPSPLLESLRHNWREILRTAGIALVQNAALYVIVTYMPTYFTNTLKYSRIEAPTAVLITMVVIVALIPPLGALSDRVGRKPMLAASCIGLIALSYPMFALMNAGNFVLATAALVVLGALLATFLSTTLIAMNELFATRVRYGGFSVGYNVSVSLFGGTAPFLVALLVAGTGNPAAPAFYIIASAVVTLAVILTLTESARMARLA
ncbi:MFS transporter [Fodinicola acaciae]|uniref:MFS transporter n=1 Tax=Fodinicola acaciae TaxID=2681555 RepID=UPI0013D508B9|nr:MFS transporter [Fodinicola acaciae]